MLMAQRYGADVLEAIWALACQLTSNGAIPRAEIRRRLAAKDSPLGRPVDIPKRTLDDILTRLRQDRGEPAQSVSQDQAPEIADAIELAALGVANLEASRIRRKQARGEDLTASDLQRLRIASTTAGELKKRWSKTPDKPGRNGPANAVSPSNLTSQLRKALEVRDDDTDTGEASTLAAREAKRPLRRASVPSIPGD